MVADGEQLLLDAVEVLLVVRRGRGAVRPDDELGQPALAVAAQRGPDDDGDATGDRLVTERVEPGAEVAGVRQRAVERGDVVPRQERLGEHEHPDVLRRGQPGQPGGGQHVGGQVTGDGDGLPRGHLT